MLPNLNNRSPTTSFPTRHLYHNFQLRYKHSSASSSYGKRTALAPLLMFLVLIFGSSVIIYNNISSSSSSSPLPSLSLSDPTTIDDDAAAEVQQAINQLAHHSSSSSSSSSTTTATTSTTTHTYHSALSSSNQNHPPKPPLIIQPWTKEEQQSNIQAVKDAVQHAWQGYVTHAWGHDELAPLSKQGKDSFGGLGATIIDSMDTLYMMGFRDEYCKAVEWALTTDQLDFNLRHNSGDDDASAFEIIIRVVGGLLAAHDVTFISTSHPADKDTIITNNNLLALIQKAKSITERLLPIYTNSKSGIPYNIINLTTQATKNPRLNLNASSLAELGTHQLEFYRLSQLTGDEKYAAFGQNSIQVMHDKYPKDGLKPLFIDPTNATFIGRKVSLGAVGDSYYEYLLKLWLLGGRREEKYRYMWVQAMDAALSRLLFTSKQGATYIAEFDRYTVKHKMDHLACFVPGMLSLGLLSGALGNGTNSGGESTITISTTANNNNNINNNIKKSQYLDAAVKLADTCYHMYSYQPSGLSPEFITFSMTTGEMMAGNYNNGGGGGGGGGAASYLHRPEAIESFWYLWRLTGDWKYRIWGLEIFKSIEKHCKVESGGYTGIKNVRGGGGGGGGGKKRKKEGEGEEGGEVMEKDDTQQSFFIAETLKYLWLLFGGGDDEGWDWENGWVMNTEAHPLRVVG